MSPTVPPTNLDELGRLEYQAAKEQARLDELEASRTVHYPNNRAGRRALAKATLRSTR